MACGHYDRYRDDVALMRDLNLGSYRFSTSWARVRPDGGAPNAAGLDFYSRLVDELLAHGIKPWLTLYHWDLPQALEERGGWANRDTASLFAEYAATVHDALGDRVGVWTTLNEPWCSAFLGYTGGVHAPGRQSREDGLAAAHHLLLGHGLAVQELRSRDAALDLGITLNFTVADPADPEDPADVDAARRIDAQFNRVFLEPVLRGAYPEDLLEDVAPYGLLDHVRDGDLTIISTPIDALGVNYYHGDLVSGRPHPDAARGEAPVRTSDVVALPGGRRRAHHPRGLPVTAMDWEVQPEGLTRLLLRLQRRLHRTGRRRALRHRERRRLRRRPGRERLRRTTTSGSSFVDLHLRAVHAAIERGVDVRGYFAWSLLDNFEWAWGYHQRFGIVRVDYDTLERTPKASARWYADVARENALPGLG